ncbi:MAG: hypothetical protein RR225_04940 [Clostridium sp.]
MTKMICPVCDKAMSTDHYCTFCRRWVKTPYVMNVDYYLNERHPARETNCEYHGSDARPAAHSTSAKQVTARNAGSQKASKAKQENSGFMKIVRVIIWVFILFNFIIPLLSMLIFW